MPLQWIPEGTLFWGQCFRGWYCVCYFELTYTAWILIPLKSLHPILVMWFFRKLHILIHHTHSPLLRSYVTSLIYWRWMDGWINRVKRNVRCAHHEHKTDKTKKKKKKKTLRTAHDTWDFVSDDRLQKLINFLLA